MELLIASFPLSRGASGGHSAAMPFGGVYKRVLGVMNPLLTLLASFFRHVTVTGLFYLVALFSLPESFRDQVESAANWVAPILVSFVAWLALKYGKPLLKKIGFLPCLSAFLALSPVGLTSCTVSFDPASGEPSVSADPVAAAVIADPVADRINRGIVDATK